jgi:hypothetical protein
MRPGRCVPQITGVSSTLEDIVASLSQADPGSDDALALVLDGRTRKAGASRRALTRFDRLEAHVIGTWAASIAAAAKKGSSNAERGYDSELTAEAQLWVLEQLAEFRPDGEGSAGAFLRTRQRWFRSSSRRGNTPGLKAKSRYKVAGVAAGQRERLLHALGREPTQAELRAAAAETLSQQLRADLLEHNPNIDENEIDSLIERRMCKDGFDRALTDFSDIQIAGKGAVYLDAFEEPDVIVKPSSNDHAAGYGELDAEDAFDQLMRVALGDNQWARSALSLKGGARPARVESEPESATYRALSLETGRPQAEIKKILTCARARITAPHAQWAHCVPGLTLGPLRP